MHIDDYQFGKITINSMTYTSDIIIYPDRVDPAWWRKQGHYLQEADLAGIVSAKPDILIIGTGNSGAMQVPEHTIHFLASEAIKSILVERTGKAVVLFNNQSGNKKVIGAFHLTC